MYLSHNKKTIKYVFKNHNINFGMNFLFQLILLMHYLC